MRHLASLLAPLALAVVLTTSTARADVAPPDSGAAPAPTTKDSSCSTSHAGTAGAAGAGLAMLGGLALVVAARRRR